MSAAARGEERIASLRHPLAIRIRKIARRPQAARRQDLFLLDGIHLFEEALAANCQPVALLTSPRLERSPAGQRLHEAICRRGWPLTPATDALLEALSTTDSSQGILGLFQRPAGLPESRLLDMPAPVPHLLLAGLQDPANVGALARTARALGCRQLITLPETADPYHARALRASSGALLGMEVAAGVPISALEAWIDRVQADLIGLDARAEQTISALSALGLDARRPPVLVLGSEGSGIPPTVARLCAQQVRIPMVREAESLGVLAAGTIALYAWLRAD